MFKVRNLSGATESVLTWIRNMDDITASLHRPGFLNPLLLLTSVASADITWSMMTLEERFISERILFDL